MASPVDGDTGSDTSSVHGNNNGRARSLSNASNPAVTEDMRAKARRFRTGSFNGHRVDSTCLSDARTTAALRMGWVDRHCACTCCADMISCFFLSQVDLAAIARTSAAASSSSPTDTVPRGVYKRTSFVTTSVSPLSSSADPILRASLQFNSLIPTIHSHIITTPASTPTYLGIVS